MQSIAVVVQLQGFLLKHIMFNFYWDRYKIMLTELCFMIFFTPLYSTPLKAEPNSPPTIYSISAAVCNYQRIKWRREGRRYILQDYAMQYQTVTQSQQKIYIITLRRQNLLQVYCTGLNEIMCLWNYVQPLSYSLLESKLAETLRAFVSEETSANTNHTQKGLNIPVLYHWDLLSCPIYMAHVQYALMSIEDFFLVSLLVLIEYRPSSNHHGWGVSGESSVKLQFLWWPPVAKSNKKYNMSFSKSCLHVYFELLLLI